jgi:2,3-bisphosphoglycerate-independent phosphoglycerate mutase
MMRKKKPTRRKTTKRHKKVVFLVMDGLADLPINGKTPLSEAEKPNMDWLAKNGMLGEIIPVPRKFWHDITKASVSHLGNLGLLGYNVAKYFMKRGPLEAVGSGIPYQLGWLAVRCNFATVDKNLEVIDRRVGRNSFGLDELARYVNEHVKIGAEFIFRRTFEHRAVLVIKEKLSDKISNSDPYNPGEKVHAVEPLTGEANRSAALVQDFIDKARGVIEYHEINSKRIKIGAPPANYILTREAGNGFPCVPNFLKKHKIKKAVAIAEPGVMKATCMLAGMDSIAVPEAKQDYTLKFIFENIENALADYDFVYAHMKGPDEPGHDGDFHKKRVAIEAIDRQLEEFKNFNGIIVISCDHITSTLQRKHEYGAVPVLVYGKGKDKIKKFDEFEAKKGKLGLTEMSKVWRKVFS